MKHFSSAGAGDFLCPGEGDSSVRRWAFVGTGGFLSFVRWLTLFFLRNVFSCQPKPGNLRFSGFGFRSPLSLSGVRSRIRPVVDHQFANWWIAPELREGHERHPCIDGHCESTPVDANANLHGGWFIAAQMFVRPFRRVVHCRADVCASLHGG